MNRMLKGIFILLLLASVALVLAVGVVAVASAHYLTGSLILLPAFLLAAWIVGDR
jgi:hypothetical protein